MRKLVLMTLAAIGCGSVFAQEGAHRYLAPVSVAPPLGQYSLGVETSPDVWWVHVAGQTGIRKDGTVPEDFAGQARVAMDNVLAILAEGGMRWEHVVSYRIYLTDREDLTVWREISADLISGAKPAATLVIVDGLVHPDWRIEIEATAARAVRRD